MMAWMTSSMLHCLEAVQPGVAAQHHGLTGCSALTYLLLPQAAMRFSPGGDLSLMSGTHHLLQLQVLSPQITMCTFRLVIIGVPLLPHWLSAHVVSLSQAANVILPALTHSCKSLHKTSVHPRLPALPICSVVHQQAEELAGP